jgi:hypothetical protein
MNAFLVSAQFSLVEQVIQSINKRGNRSTCRVSDQDPHGSALVWVAGSGVQKWPTKIEKTQKR